MSLNEDFSNFLFCIIILKENSKEKKLDFKFDGKLISNIKYDEIDINISSNLITRVYYFNPNSKINLYYKNKNLSKLIDKTLLEEITTEGEKNLTINIQKENEVQSINNDIPISNIIYNSRLNDFDNEKNFQKLRNRFLEYQKKIIFKNLNKFLLLTNF